MSDGRLPITQHYYHIYTAQIRQIVNKGILVFLLTEIMR